MKTDRLTGGKYFQHVPIEFDTSPGFIRRDRPARFNYQRALCVSINREAVNLKPATMRLRRNKADVKLLHAVTADRNAMTFGQRRGPQPTCDAQAI